MPQSVQNISMSKKKLKTIKDIKNLLNKRIFNVFSEQSVIVKLTANLTNCFALFRR